MDERTSWTPGDLPEPSAPSTPAWSTPSTPAAPAGPPPPGSSYVPPAPPEGSPYAPPAGPGPHAGPATPAAQPVAPYGPATYGAAPGGYPTAPGQPPSYGSPPSAEGFGGPALPYGASPWSTPPPQAGTDGLAVAALIVGIVGTVVPILGQIVAIVLGAVALSRIKRTGRGGRGMAIAGISIGAAWIALAIASAVAIPVFLNQRRVALHDQCADGDMAACDRLYETAADGSAEQDFGNTCGGRTDGGYLCTAIGDETYGDDDHLDALWDACAEGDGPACDELAWSADPDSDYSAYGWTCGGRTDGSVDCVDALDPASSTT